MFFPLWFFVFEAGLLSQEMKGFYYYDYSVYYFLKGHIKEKGKAELFV